MPTKNQFGEGTRCNDCSSLARPALVPKNHESTNPSPSASPIGSAHSSLQSQSCSQTSPKPSSSCLSHIRRFYEKQNFSKESIEILCASWRNSTKYQYEIYFKKWISFCNRQNLDPFSYNEINCVHFLTELFHQNKSYSAINTARSALSTFLYNNSGLTIGNSPPVKRLMKGIFELRPSTPRYNFIWDVSIVLDFLKNFYPLEDINFNILSYKCVMLLALASMQRVQTLHVIDVNDVNFVNDSVMIPIKKLLKQFNARNNKLMIYLKSFDDPVICPVLTLKHYITMSQKLRGDNNQLFISFQKPHKPVSKSTLSRWIKRVMEESGIDTTCFKAHSTRAAASSAARSENIPIDDIL